MTQQDVTWCTECGDGLTSDRYCTACLVEEIETLQKTADKMNEDVARKDAVIAMIKSGVLKHDAINDAINTAVGICNLSDDKHVIEMEKHIAESLANIHKDI